MCGANRYAGSFTCTSDGGGLFSTVFGQLTFELVDDDMGESQGVLMIADGLLSDSCIQVRRLLTARSL